MFRFWRNSSRAVLTALLILSTAAATVSIPAPLVAQAATLPELPRVYLNTAYTPPTGPTISVPAGGDLQAALNAAQPGSIISLEAGATYSGNFSLPAKAGTGWIYVQSSVLSSLPLPGTRVTPALASLMPKIVGKPAITAASSAAHWRFVGIEVTHQSGQAGLDLTDLRGTDIVFDRCYVHGRPGEDLRVGLVFNGARLAVVDSWIAEVHHRQFDSMAVWGWTGPGPFKIVNNYLQGAGENVIFGGTDASSQAYWPSDIEVRGNYFFKPLSWKVSDPSYAGINWVVKNIFELKNARRVLVDGNIFENNWTGNTNSQGGFAIVLTPRNQYGGNPRGAVQDVAVHHNTARRPPAPRSFLGWDDRNTAPQQHRAFGPANGCSAICLFPQATWYRY